MNTATTSGHDRPQALPRRAVLQALAAAGGLALLAACSRSPTAQPLPPGSTVLALGDSLTYGTGASPDTAYPAVLARLSGWQVINAGVPGDTSAQALARLPELLQEHQPKLVIVSIGGNDFLRQLPEQDTRDNILAICQMARAQGAQVLLVAVPRPSLAAALGRLADHALYEDIAKAQALPLQSKGWAEVLGDADLRSDRVHANAKGYAQFAQTLWETARDVGLAR